MILKSSIRGDGVPFANYLLHSKKNERARILEISGTGNTQSLHDSLFEMCLMAELTRSQNPLLQVIIRPAEGEDQGITDEQWQFCLDAIEKKIGFQGQPRAAVIHTYDGGDHMHAVWGRYDNETGIMKPISHIAQSLKQARLDIELELGHAHLLSWQERKAIAVQEKLLEDERLQMQAKEQLRQAEIEAARLEKLAAEKARQLEKMTQFVVSEQDLFRQRQLEKIEKSNKLYQERKQNQQDHGLEY